MGKPAGPEEGATAVGDACSLAAAVAVALSEATAAASVDVDAGVAVGVAPQAVKIKHRITAKARIELLFFSMTIPLFFYSKQGALLPVDGRNKSVKQIYWKPKPGLISIECPIIHL